MNAQKIIHIINTILPEPLSPDIQNKFALSTNTNEEVTIYVEESKQIFTKLIHYNRIQVRLPLSKFSFPFFDSKPRLLRINNGAQRIGQAPSTAKKYHHRGLRLIEGLWLVTFYPEILKHHSIDLVESIYSMECIPTLYYWQNKIHLSAICPDVSDSMCGAPYVLEEILC